MDAITNAIPAITSKSSLDVIEAVKWAGVIAYVLSTLGVVIGVALEHERFPKLGHKILLWSLGLDTFFTIWVFAAEGLISHIQRTEIIVLERAAGPRNLTPAEIAYIVAKLKPSGPVTYDLAVAPLLEPNSLLLNQLVDALKQSGWELRSVEGNVAKGLLSTTAVMLAMDITPGTIGKLPTILVAQSVGVTGVGIFWDFTKYPKLDRHVGALLFALNDVGIAAQAIPLADREDAAPNRIHITIGTK